MAKKGRNKKSRQPEKDVPPVLPARVWEEICENMNFSMVNDMPGMGYFPVVDSGIRYKIPENDGNPTRNRLRPPLQSSMAMKKNSPWSGSRPLQIAAGCVAKSPCIASMK